MLSFSLTHTHNTQSVTDILIVEDVHIHTLLTIISLKHNGR